MRVSKIFLISGFVLMATACQQPKSSSSSIPQSNWVVFGDSVAYGTGAQDDKVKPTGCLSEHLKEPVLNLAIPGSTSRDGLKVLPQVLQAKPKAVLISLGGNDVLRHMNSGDFPAEQTESNMRQIFQTLKKAGVKVYYLGLEPPLSSSADLSNQMSWSRLYDMKRIAQDEGAVFIPDSRGWKWLSSDYMADQIHPNDRGYRILCEGIEHAL